MKHNDYGDENLKIDDDNILHLFLHFARLILKRPSWLILYSPSLTLPTTKCTSTWCAVTARRNQFLTTGAAKQWSGRSWQLLLCRCCLYLQPAHRQREHFLWQVTLWRNDEHSCQKLQWTVYCFCIDFSIYNWSDIMLNYAECIIAGKWIVCWFRVRKIMVRERGGWGKW